MSGRVRVLGVDRGGQGTNHAEEEVLEVAVEAGVGTLGAQERRHGAEEVDFAGEHAIVARIDGEEPSGMPFRVRRGHGVALHGREIRVRRAVADPDPVRAQLGDQLRERLVRHPRHFARDHGRFSRRCGDPRHGLDLDRFPDRRGGPLLESFGTLGDAQAADELVDERRAARRAEGLASGELGGDAVGDRLAPGEDRPLGPVRGPFRAVERDGRDPLAPAFSGQGQAEPEPRRGAVAVAGVVAEAHLIRVQAEALGIGEFLGADAEPRDPLGIGRVEDPDGSLEFRMEPDDQPEGLFVRGRSCRRIRRRRHHP